MSRFQLHKSKYEKRRWAIFVIASLVFGFSGCRIQTVKHSPVRAVIDTNQFLKAFYFDEDYAKALDLASGQLRQSATTDDLKKMVEEMKQERGALKTLRADSYLMTQGDTMELFYIGEYEHGVLYLRLVLMGDASSGYRVSGVWFQPEPYPENPLRRKFDVEIFVG
jgi:hypothetical protein